MFGQQAYSPQAFAIANALQQGPVKVTQAFRQYANEAAYARDGNLLGNAPTAAESFESAFGPTQQSSGERGAAHIPTPLVKAGEALGVDKFIQQDLRPRLSGTVRGVRDLVRGLVQMASPRTGVRQDHLDAVYNLKGDREKARFVLQSRD